MIDSTTTGGGLSGSSNNNNAGSQITTISGFRQPLPVCDRLQLGLFAFILARLAGSLIHVCWEKSNSLLGPNSIIFWGTSLS